jgi:hypothetical protein
MAALIVGADGATIALGATAAPPPLAASQSAAGAGPGVADSSSGTLTTADSTPTATTDATSGASTTSSTYYSETSSQIVYHGTWSSATYSGYLGGRIKWSRQKGATAVFSFTGTGVSWIGPVGPTRGQAKVYINGRYVKTVSMYARSFIARHTIYTASFATAQARSLKILVVGTAGRPTVAIDALVVRHLTTGAAAPLGSNAAYVSSISGLRSALANNAIDEIVVANGTYHVSPSGLQRSDSLWVGGGAIASRTRPVLVRAETRGGVVFDGGGGSGYAGLSFEDGAHDQTWDGFVFARMGAHSSGIIEVGGYVPRRTPHHLTLRHITIARSCTGSATSATAPTLDHAVYISNAANVGPHDLLFEDVSVDGRGGLASAFHFDHGDATNPNATNVVVRRLHVVGTQQAILLWQPAVHTITFDHVDITSALYHAIRFESIGATAIVFSNIVSTGTGTQPFYSSMGLHPPGVTLINNSLQ